MKRIFGAALLALAASPAAFAQPVAPVPPPGFDPNCPPGAAAHRASFCCDYAGCGCFCMRLFGKMHMHGPLFNYGPYSGYYPFEPYGPWNAQLQYTGPYPGNIGCGPYGLFGKHCGLGGCGLRGCGGGLGHGGLFHRDGCGGIGWNRYACSTFRNVFHRTHPLFHRAKCDVGCSACALAPTTADTGVRAASAEQPAR